MTRIYLVRHAHADWQPSEARPLSARGRASADMLADRFGSLPISAIYSSPSRRALQTVDTLAARLQLQSVLLPDLRERELVAATAAEFEAAVEATWREPDRPYRDGESNNAARLRGVAVTREVVERHPGADVMLSTHGSLLAIVLNAFDETFGYEFWRTLTFPDVYEMTFREGTFAGVRRVWNDSDAASPTSPVPP